MKNLCNNCRLKSICKYSDQVDLIIKETEQVKSNIEENSPIKIELECTRFEKINRKQDGIFVKK